VETAALLLIMALLEHVRIAQWNILNAASVVEVAVSDGIGGIK